MKNLIFLPLCFALSIVAQDYQSNSENNRQMQEYYQNTPSLHPTPKRPKRRAIVMSQSVQNDSDSLGRQKKFKARSLPFIHLDKNLNQEKIR